MKKSLIALAVAGAFAAPAFAATSNVDVYGVLNIAIQDTNATITTPALGASVGAIVAPGAAGSTPTVLDNTSRIGFKGSEDLGGGLKAVWQIESALGGNGAIMGSADMAANRNTFVGLAGGFGTAIMGRHDTPYKLGTASLDIFADTIADYNLGRLGQSIVNNTHDARLGQAVAYISPTWSGFHFAAAVVMSNGEAGHVVNKADTTFDATSLTGVYANGPLFASLSFQDVKVLSSKGTKVGLGYTIGDAKLGFVWESINNAGAGTDTRAWLVNGVYNMGPIALKAQYGKNNNGTALANGDAWALGLDYNLSKRTSAYFVYGTGDIGAADADGWNLGVKHSF